MGDLGKEDMRGLMKWQNEEIAGDFQPLLKDINSHLSAIEASLERLVQAMSGPSRPQR